LAEKHALPFADAIERTRTALAELRALGDNRRFVQSLDSLFAMINIDHPGEALTLACDAAEIADSLGDEVSYGRAVYRVCDAAFDMNDVETFAHWRPLLERSQLPPAERIDAMAICELFDAARIDVPGDIAVRLLRAADERQRIGDANAVPLIAGAASALLWVGRLAEASEVFESRGAVLPPVGEAVIRLTIRALEGPPWPLHGISLPTDTSVHNERALLHYLRGEDQVADALLMERYEHRVATAGTSFQRFTAHFPGALVAALGPPETRPPLQWLDRWLTHPPLPNLWAVHRAIAAMLLCERGGDVSTHAAQALQILGSTDADGGVSAWIHQRLNAAAGRYRAL
jgi:hypothetical protein